MSEPVALLGHDLFGAPVERQATSPVAERFIMAPFSTLDAKQGEWKARKDAWKSLGIKSEIGRDGNLLRQFAKVDKAAYGAAHTPGEYMNGSEAGISIFDPVLCELAYRWWCPPGGHVLDPFAGGSVRGIVASLLGRQYQGIDLRADQVEANREQARTICAGADYQPEWLVGDSLDLGTPELPVRQADFLFSCPPYADLEQYSDDPRDLSNMEYGDFRAFYREIIKRAVAHLRPDRFACFVVGEVRDKRSGHYRNFVGDTVRAFQDAGAAYYSEALYLTPIGTWCLRITRQFNGGRKLAKVHQTVLVFVKGDWRKATAALGSVEVGE